MTESLKYTFSIKRVKKTNDIDYINAIKIYNENIPFDIRTDSNEITSWLNEDLNKSPFVPYCFILYFNNEVVGFAMETYIKRTKIMVGEYITLQNEFHSETVLFTFLDLMHNYYRINNIDISYFVDEISNKNSGNSVDKESKLFKKMLCVQGFGEIDAPYTTLPLGLNNFESSFDAKIFIKSNDELKLISKETYLSIVESIYYDYFIVWYKDMFTEREKTKYKQKVDCFFKSISDDLIKESELEIKFVDCPVLKESQDSYKTINIPNRKQSNILKWLFIILVLIVLPPIIALIYTSILNFLHIETNTVSSLLGESLSGLLTFISAYVIYKKAL